ncbi:ABC transporter permease [Meiothermus taiwanensis]|uniref:Bicarbonate transport system permease protein CmpB n=2 Tax=Meiothermus taiwanensis TaxID=172827 RepID=A0A399DSI3_9DEIN|nr:ABC transporter permease subunit [Meiothermus taiwanensis]AWR88085.1 binding-protein-dependent transport systems inner membrane component [Meiothermus taiwanensis WR-220]KIQ53374.1 ABC transporter permease [Meiothermus taiwanensis]KZK17013.1 ABC transporter permease [Meiothermus taiwanensis]RIH74393.1 Bicarbonate transport system permease protein CmpB [Meiothermus taiwanensis]
MKRVFSSPEVLRPRAPFSRWDLVVIPGILLLLLLLTLALRGATAPYGPNTPDLTVSLNPVYLPYYGLRTLLRMLAALLLSLTFTLIYATIAAKIPRTERVLIPILDFLQSLPILGFLTATTAIFLGLFRGNLFGLEAASIFAIFSSQVWNMTFSFYASLRTVPRELQEAAALLRLSSWQRFWKLEVPFGLPNLVWNAMMSVSGGWFFVVASEVIRVVGRDHDQYLPGVGAYIALAIQQADVQAMLWAGLTLFLLVLLYDQLLFRPVVAWAEKFKFEQSESSDTAQSWMLTLLQRARLSQHIARLPQPLWEWLWFRSARGHRPGVALEPAPRLRLRSRVADLGFNLLIVLGSLALMSGFLGYLLGSGLGFKGGQMLQPNPNLNTQLSPEIAQRFAALDIAPGTDGSVWLSQLCAASRGGQALSSSLKALLDTPGVWAPANLAAACQAPLAPAGKVAWPEVLEVLKLGFFTALRVTFFVLLVTLIWLPIGVYVGLRPRLTQWVQPLAQFGAAFPANLLFPLFVVTIVHFRLNPEIWVSPLMVLGGQWYILFNAIAGSAAIPNDLKEAARIYGLRGWNRWRRLILPAIFPAFVTGGITATGGSWNASIVAEVVKWGDTTLVATGLGAYIARWSTGEFNPHVGLGMLVMGLLVLTYNRLIWRRLYQLAEERYRLD